MLREAIEKLKLYQTKEKKGSILEDKTLIGYFTFIETLILKLSTINKDNVQAVITYTGLINELFYECIFYNPEKSKTENKTKTKESRAAAYSLLNKTVEVLEPKELADFLE